MLPINDSDDEAERLGQDFHFQGAFSQKWRGERLVHFCRRYKAPLTGCATFFRLNNVLIVKCSPFATCRGRGSRNFLVFSLLGVVFEALPFFVPHVACFAALICAMPTFGVSHRPSVSHHGCWA